MYEYHECFIKFPSLCKLLRIGKFDAKTLINQNVIVNLKNDIWCLTLTFDVESLNFQNILKRLIPALPPVCIGYSCFLDALIFATNQPQSTREKITKNAETSLDGAKEGAASLPQGANAIRIPWSKKRLRTLSNKSTKLWKDFSFTLSCSGQLKRCKDEKS